MAIARPQFHRIVAAPLTETTPKEWPPTNFERKPKAKKPAKGRKAKHGR